MDLEFKTFDLSQSVYFRLRSITDRHRVSFAVTIRKCLALGNFIRLEQQEARFFFMGTQLLELPDPEPIPDHPAMPLTITVNPEMTATLEQIGETFIIDEHSILGWSAECLDIIDDARTIAPVITRGNSGIREIPLS